MGWVILIVILGVLAALALREYRFTRTMAAKSREAVPPKGDFIEISTGKLHYLEKGSGPAILLIHGLGGNLRHFDMGVIDNLATDHRVVAVDRPGMGWSDRPDDAPANLQAQAGYMAEVISALSLDRPLLVGHSLGGGISLALALDHPELTRGLALVAPLCLPTDQTSPAFKAQAIPSPLMRKLVSLFLSTRATIRNRDANLDLVFGPEPVPGGFPLQGGGLMALRPDQFRNMSRDFLHAGDDLNTMLARYDTLPQPVQIITGRDDRILPIDQQAVELNRRFPQIKVDLVDGGHMLPLTQPELTAQFIRRVDALT
ncbi:MAG: alpha/beta hydrolase [Paracoccaceae bacterium]